MEIKKLQLSLSKKQKGIINVYLIPEVGSMDSGFIIDEYSKNYQATNAHYDNKIDQIELASIIYEFVTSDYFVENKPIVYLGYTAHFSKDNEYPDVFQGLSPLFNQVSV